MVFEGACVRARVCTETEKAREKREREGGKKRETKLYLTIWSIPNIIQRRWWTNGTRVWSNDAIKLTAGKQRTPRAVTSCDTNLTQVRTEPRLLGLRQATYAHRHGTVFQASLTSALNGTHGVKDRSSSDLETRERAWLLLGIERYSSVIQCVASSAFTPWHPSVKTDIGGCTRDRKFVGNSAQLRTVNL
jgi:hypothetical protein